MKFPVWGKMLVTELVVWGNQLERDNPAMERASTCPRERKTISRNEWRKQRRL